MARLCPRCTRPAAKSGLMARRRPMSAAVRPVRRRKRRPRDSARRSWHSPPMPQLSMHSPIGDLTISEEDGAIVAVDWGWGRDQTESELLTRAVQQLNEYFDGTRTSFDLPLKPSGTG